MSGDTVPAAASGVRGVPIRFHLQATRRRCRRDRLPVKASGPTGHEDPSPEMRSLIWARPVLDTRFVGAPGADVALRNPPLLSVASETPGVTFECRVLREADGRQSPSVKEQITCAPGLSGLVTGRASTRRSSGAAGGGNSSSSRRPRQRFYYVPERDQIHADIRVLRHRRIPGGAAELGRQDVRVPGRRVQGLPRRHDCRRVRGDLADQLERYPARPLNGGPGRRLRRFTEDLPLHPAELVQVKVTMYARGREIYNGTKVVDGLRHGASAFVSPQERDDPRYGVQIELPPPLAVDASKGADSIYAGGRGEAARSRRGRMCCRLYGEQSLRTAQRGHHAGAARAGVLPLDQAHLDRQRCRAPGACPSPRASARAVSGRTRTDTGWLPGDAQRQRRNVEDSRR